MTSIDTSPHSDCFSPSHHQHDTDGTVHPTEESDTESEESGGWSVNSDQAEETPPTGHSIAGHSLTGPSYFAEISRNPSTSYQAPSFSPVDESVLCSSTRGSHNNDYSVVSNAASSLRPSSDRTGWAS